MKRIRTPLAIFLALAPGVAFAQEIAPASETSIFVFNTMLLFFCGIVVMFMAAGFCMLEVGLVRSKNAASICLKNVAAYAVASIMVWLVGYHLIYGVEPGGFLGSFSLWSPSDIDPVGKGVASGADFFFQLVFVATAASIVSGALAERVKLSAFILSRPRSPASSIRSSPPGIGARDISTRNGAFPTSPARRSFIRPADGRRSPARSSSDRVAANSTGGA